MAEVLHLGQLPAADLGAREGRQVRCHERQVERSGSADLAGEFDHAGVAGEASELFGAGSEVGAGRAGEPGVDLVETAAGPDRGDRRGESPLRRGGVVHVVGGDALDTGAVGDLDERVVASRVDRVAVVPQLDEHPVASERSDHLLQLTTRCRRPVGHQRRRHRPFATAGQDPAQATDLVGDVGERELRRTLLPCQVAEAQRPRQAGVAGRSVGEHEQVPAVRVGGVRVGQLTGVDLEQGVAFGADDVLFVTQTGGQRDLGPEHRRQTHGARRLGEAHHTVEPVVVGEGERLETEPGRFGGEFLGVRGAVEERVVRVAVELGVRHRAGHPCQRGVERLAFAPPRRTVATGVPRQAARGAPIAPSPTGEGRFELAPAPRRIVETQVREYRTFVRTRASGGGIQQFPDVADSPRRSGRELRVVPGA